MIKKKHVIKHAELINLFTYKAVLINAQSILFNKNSSQLKFAESATNYNNIMIKANV